MEIKQFKRFFQNENKRMLRDCEIELAKLQESLHTQIQMRDEIASLTIISSPITVKVIDSATDEEKEDDISFVNKRKYLKELDNTISILKEEIISLQESIASLEQCRQMYNNPEFISPDGNAVHGLIDIVRFATTKKIPFDEIYKVIGMFININGTYLRKHGPEGLYQKDDLEPYLIERIMTLSPYFDKNGNIVKTDNTAIFQVTLAELMSILVIHTTTGDPLAFSENYAQGMDALTLFQNDYMDAKNNKHQPLTKQPVEQPIRVTEVKPLPKYQYTSRLKIKEYIRGHQVIKSCPLPEFQLLLQECQVDETERKYLMGLMEEYNNETLKNAQLNRRILAINRFFTSEEKMLYEEYLDSEEIAIRRIIGELSTIADLLADDESLQEELAEEKQLQFELLKALTNYVPPIPEVPIIYLDESLMPIFLKNYDRLEKQEKKKAIQLIEKIQNKSGITLAKPVLGKNNRGILYIASGKIKLCFTESSPGEYIILSVGKDDTVFADALRIVSSAHFQQFVVDIKNPNYRTTTLGICQQSIEEMRSKTIAKKENAKLELKGTTN